MTFYTTHIDAAETLGLYGSDAQVYFALAYLAKHQPWRGSYRELARLSRCGCKETARVAVARLVSKGLLVQSEQGWSLTEKLPQATRILPTMTKKLPKLKESNKENINNK